jgi:hypothetical protein
MKALAAKKGITPDIILVVGVLRPVSLDDQPLGEAGEIDNIGLDHLLTLELEAAEPLSPQD